MKDHILKEGKKICHSHGWNWLIQTTLRMLHPRLFLKNQTPRVWLDTWECKSITKNPTIIPESEKNQLTNVKNGKNLWKNHTGTTTAPLRVQIHYEYRSTMSLRALQIISPTTSAAQDYDGVSAVLIPDFSRVVILMREKNQNRKLLSDICQKFQTLETAFVSHKQKLTTFWRWNFANFSQNFIRVGAATCRNNRGVVNAL